MSQTSFNPYKHYASTLLCIFCAGIWAGLLAVPCWRDPIRPKQLSTAANIQAHSFFKGFSMGLDPLTREAILPYLVAVSLPARMCNTVIFYIPATSHKRYASILLDHLIPELVIISVFYTPTHFRSFFSTFQYDCENR